VLGPHCRNDSATGCAKQNVIFMGLEDVPMAIGLKGSVVCVSIPHSPPPHLRWAVDVMFLSLVVLSGLEFLVDEMFGCELQRRLVLKDCRVGFSGNLDQTITQLNAPDNFWPQRHEPT
jgi:hypothetical protein